MVCTAEVGSVLVGTAQKVGGGEDDGRAFVGVLKGMRARVRRVARVLHLEGRRRVGLCDEALALVQGKVVALVAVDERFLAKVRRGRAVKGAETAGRRDAKIVRGQRIDGQRTDG